MTSSCAHNRRSQAAGSCRVHTLWEQKWKSWVIGSISNSGVRTGWRLVHSQPERLLLLSLEMLFPFAARTTSCGSATSNYHSSPLYSAHFQSVLEVPMRTKLSLLFALLLASVFAQTSLAHESADVLTSKAVSENAPESSAAIGELRAMGPAGLAVLRERYAKEIDRHVNDPSLLANREWQRIATALDAVSQQKDSYISGLYWYTDFQEARKASRDSGKPILSLRLLGKLSEEFSCANSRFFRTVLYSNAEVAAALRERFILHWQSVRPAPRVTIDFGDGRKLERTLTGNSIHYILDSAGYTVDALPGLYGPTAFLRELTAIEGLLRQPANLQDGNRVQTISLYQRDRLNKLTLAWLADVEKTGGKIPEGFVVSKREDGTPEALRIKTLAITKMVTEENILQRMTAGSEALERVTD